MSEENKPEKTDILIWKGIQSISFGVQQETAKSRIFSHGWDSVEGFTTYITKAVSDMEKLNS